MDEVIWWFVSMKIAVLMSTYNGERYVQEQIESILNQKGEFQLDLWVRDDGSTDRTKEILQGYADAGLLKWYTGANLKAAYSFLDLLKHCEGYDYYAFADQDDYWMLEKISKGIEMLTNEGTPMLYCSNAQLVDCDLNSLNRNVYKQIPKMDFYTVSCAGGLLGCTMIFNQSLARMVQKKELPETIIMHDFYVALLCLTMNGQIVYDNGAYIKYRQHDNNVVGVSHGFKDKLCSRVKEITTKAPVTLAEQTDSLLELYGDEIEQENCDWLASIRKCNGSLTARVHLAFSRKVKYINWNMSIKNRLAILFGNR